MDKIKANSEKISLLLKNLSNKDKMWILCYLWNTEKNVWDLLKCTSLSQSQVSQYLWKMKLEWILESNKRWKEVFYKIKDKQVLEVISALKKIFN